MSIATRFACTLVFLMSCWTMVGCSGSGDTTPESEIPDIPPTTRTMPGQDGATGGQKGDFIPAPPPG